VIVGFGDKTTEDIFTGRKSREARRIPQDLWAVARRKLDMLNAAADLQDLRVPPANRLEKLRGNLALFHSIRVNDQFRIIFVWANGNASEVRVLDYHD
jgi:proteic killer suppression protein